MGYFKIKKFQISPYLAAISASLGILAGIWVLDRSEQQRFWQYNRASTLNQVSTIRSNLEGALNSRILVMRGLVAYISNKPNITEAEFAATARILLAEQKGIRSIGLVKGTTIAYMYPRQGNESAIGVDLMSVPQQRQMVEEAIETRKTVLAGPVKLLAGNLGFICRSPIFLTPPGADPETGVFWGLTGVLIDQEELLQEVGLKNPSTKLEYALRGKDGKGASGKVFFGREAVFEQAPVLLEVTLPTGSWQLAAIPLGGWPTSSPLRGFLWGGGGLLAVLSSVLAFNWVYGPAKLRESEVKYRQLVENANCIIVQLDSQGNVTFFNEFAESFFGYSEAEIIGKSAIGTIIPETDLNLVAMAQDFLAYPERYLHNENESIRRNGEKVWIAWRNQALRDRKGGLKGLLCIGTDISDRKLAEAALLESESRYRAIVEDQTELICRFLPNGVMTFVNDAYCRYFNKSRSELIGNTFLPFIFDADRERFDESFRSLSIENPFLTHEHRVILETGEIRTHQWTNRGFFDNAGNSIEFQGVGRDISDRKQAEIALQNSEAEMRALFAAMNDIIFELDIEGRFLKVAPTNPQLLYQPTAEFVSKKISDLFAPEMAEFFMEKIRIALATNQTCTFEYNLEIASVQKWFAATISPMKKNTALWVARDITERKQAESWLAGQKQVLEMIAKSTPLGDTLNTLVEIIEQQSKDVKASILLLDKEGKHLLHGAGPSLPESYNAAIHGIALGDNVGSCGTAVFRKEPVIVKDIASDPLWENYRNFALSFGLRACWSTPIFSSDGQVLGTFAMYYDRPNTPDDFEWQLLEVVKSLAGIAIERKQAEESLKQLNQDLENRVIERTSELSKAFKQLQTEIAERQEAEQELTESESRFQKLAANLPGMVYQCLLRADNSVSFPYMSPACREMFELEPEAVQENSDLLVNLVHPEDRQEYYESIAIAAQNMQPWQWQGRLIMPSGKTKWFQVISRPEAKENGDILWDGITIDVTDRKQAEEAIIKSEARERERSQQLEQALLELRSTQTQLVQTEKMSSLGQLVAGIAHEINNPVNFIHANISYLKLYTKQLLDLVALYEQEYPDPKPKIVGLIEEIDLDFMGEDLIKIVGSMQVGTERIRQIVLSLRNFSRLDESEMKPVDIHAGIDSTLLIVQHRLKAKDCWPAIQVVKEFGNLPRVECYPSQLNQVFMNIIVNGVDAIEERYHQLSVAEAETNPGQISIRTMMANQHTVMVEISDNGTGIPEAVRNRIFNPFFTTKEVGKGTGLGMSISHSIVVEKHKGKINCISSLGKGTTFQIEIPIGKLDRSHK